MIMQIDLQKTKRESMWAVTCVNCTYERIVTYCQAYNIKKGISSGMCKSCKAKSTNNSGRFEKGSIPHNKGKQFKVVRNYKKNKKQMEITNAFGGTIFTDTIKRKMSNAKKGKMENLANNWQNGATKKHLKIRTSKPMQDWRKTILKRDNYTCQECNSVENLHVHHIKSFAKYKELRMCLDNGITLCNNCHKTKHKKGVK